MSVTWIIIYISMVAWIFPMFRQFKNNIFYFFLFLGLSDPISLLLLKTLHLRPGIISVIIAPILFYSINIDRQKPFKINWLEIFIFVLTFTLLPILKNYDLILLIITTLTLIRVLYRILIELHHKQIINIFYIVLTFYLITAVASLIIYLNGDHQGIILFHINLSFQILVAIFFSIFREDHPKLTYNISPVNQE